MRSTRMGRWVGFLIAIVATLALQAVATPAARADEWMFDAYVGPNFPDGDADAGKATMGGRFGYWFTLLDRLDAGVFVDSGAALAEKHQVKQVVVPTSALFMARVPFLKSPDFPSGILQPYAGVGPSVVWSQVDVKAGGDDDTTDAGLDVRAGLSGMLLPNVGLFAEFRYTYFEPSYDQTIGDVKVRFHGDQSTYHALFGVTFRL